MSDILVTIANKDYRIACEPGQQAHLTSLAGQLDTRLAHLKQHFGEIGDVRLCVMACLQLLDEASDNRAENEVMKTQMLRLGEAHKALSQKADMLENELAQRLGDATQRLGQLAHLLAAQEQDKQEQDKNAPDENTSSETASEAETEPEVLQQGEAAPNQTSA